MTSLHEPPRQGVRAELDTLNAVLAKETARYYGDCRLRDIHFALANPLKTAQLATTLASGFRDGDLSEHLAAAVRHLDLAPADDGAHLADSTIQEHLSGLDSTLLKDVLGPFVEADLLVQHAFAALSDSERTHLYTHVPTLLKALDTGDGGLDYEDSTRAATNIRTLRLAKEVDISSLAAAATQLSRLAQAASLKRIRKVAGKLDDTPGEVELPSTFQGTFLYAASRSASSPRWRPISAATTRTSTTAGHQHSSLAVASVASGHASASSSTTAGMIATSATAGAASPAGLQASA